MQTNPNRIKMGWYNYWWRPFCPCCCMENDDRARSFRPHTHQKRMSKEVTLRTHRDGSRGGSKRVHGEYSFRPARW